MHETYFNYSSNAFGVATALYVLAMMLYITYLIVKNKGIGYAATAVTIGGFVSQTAAFVLRWMAFYYMSPDMGFIRAVPLTNLYESLVFFVWSLILIYLIIEFKYKTHSFGAFITPVAAMALAFIEMYGISDHISPLVPALQSNWLLVHVFMSFIAYAAFAIAFATALMYLIVKSDKQPDRSTFWGVSGAAFLIFALINQNPSSLPLWIAGFLLIIAIDIVLNVEIAQKVFKSSDGGTIKTVMYTIGLSLITIAAMFLFIQLIKLQIIKAQQAADIRGTLDSMIGVDGQPILDPAKITGKIMGTIAVVFFLFVALIKYLLLKKDFYLYWTMTAGGFITVLGAMTLDFIFYRTGGSAKPFTGKSVLFMASFKNPDALKVVLSFIAAFGVLFLVWHFGHRLKGMFDKFKVPAAMLEEITYSAIAFGFPIFTLGGLIFGAIWADQAWGVYWSWDPKETWSLITWFGYAAFLHARYMRGWRGLNVSVVSIISFMLVIFTYLGVNLLLSGLHAYGSG